MIPKSGLCPHAGDGEGSEVLMKETSSNFKFYASGRRFCRGFLATLDLRRRQDLFSLALHLVSPHDDMIDIEVLMSDNTMPPMVLAIATPRLAKEMMKEGGPEGTGSNPGDHIIYSHGDFLNTSQVFRFHMPTFGFWLFCFIFSCGWG
jgi:hypothetical protein